ncbi:hypothetical protein LE181_01895 [Streptomyces sp. SCA3-4]|uniref:hypothetical protein n=1 Tax=Streptomyces sichuanensis TaxID=2871810 RepID=UPI001CE27B30|nr:hypothetical protein [Streptomyces sichuanensis]MCA6090927.1 hypothetical protein [Streptomyces sichuanensis]
MTIAHPREAFPLAPEGGSLLYSSEPPTHTGSRPWILRFAISPDPTKATVKPPAFYDEQVQMSVGLYDGPLPYMQTEDPTIPDGDTTNPPPLDEGVKD